MENKNTFEGNNFRTAMRALESQRRALLAEAMEKDRPESIKRAFASSSYDLLARAVVRE